MEGPDGERTQVEAQNTAYFRQVYHGEHAHMRWLYEQAKIDQWNTVTDIDWSCPLEAGHLGLIPEDDRAVTRHSTGEATAGCASAPPPSGREP